MMAPGVSEGIYRADHESKTFHYVRFSSKRGLKPLKIAFFAIIEKNVELNTHMLEPSLFSEIYN